MFLSRAVFFFLSLVFYEVSSLTIKPEKTTELNQTEESGEVDLKSSTGLQNTATFIDDFVSNNVLLFENELKGLQKQLRQLNQFNPAVRGLGDNIVRVIDDLTKVIRERIKNFQEKAQCIFKRVNSAQQQATQEIQEVGKCVIKAAKKANNDIDPILKDFERELERLSKLLTKVIRDLFQCREADRIIPCSMDVIRAAERKFSAISDSIGDTFKDAGLCWNTLRRDMAKCFTLGIGQATVFDNQLRENILKCLQ